MSSSEWIGDDSSSGWDHSKEFPIRRWFGWNFTVNLALILTAIMLAVFVSPFFLLLWPAVIILDDIMLGVFRLSIFDNDEGIQACYRWQNFFMFGSTGAGRDLGFNLYDGNVSKALDQAQVDKWEFVIDKLDLKPGDRLLDVGCGFGDWLNYAKSKGISVTGINITDEQVFVARSKYGLNIHRVNYKDVPKDPKLVEELYGKFDAVTFMDTIEHYAHAADYRNPDKVDQIYREMFEFAHNLIDPKTRTGRVFISCLHWTEEDPRNPKGKDRDWTIVDNISGILMVRTYSGLYPRGPQGLTRNAEGLFEEIERSDRTEDYRYSGVVDNAHFQAPKFTWNLRKILFFPLFMIIDPHFIHKWIGHNAFGIKFDSWMRTYGKDYFSTKYDPEFRAKVSHVQLWWLVMKANVRSHKE